MATKEFDITTSTKSTKRPKGWGSRHTTAVLGFWAMCILYALRFNLSIAIVAMVKSKATEHQLLFDNGCRLESTQGSLLANTKPEEAVRRLNMSVTLKPQPQSDGITVINTFKGEFNWSREEQGILLGSYFWGNAVTQIPGGILAQRYGPKWPIGGGILVSCLLTLVIPWAARAGLYYLIVVRVLMGLLGGVVWPSMHLLLGKWAPRDERSILVSIVYAGPQFGTAIATVACGYLIDWEVFGGWPSAFYVLGSGSLTWFLFWCMFVYNAPTKNPRITSQELAYIESSLGDTYHAKRLPTPWKSIFTSLPLWAILIAHVGEDWGLYTLLTELPTYMSTVLKFDITKNSWMSALPQLARWAFGISLTFFADFLIHKRILRVVTVRKMCNTLGHWGAAAALVAFSYAGCNPTLAIMLLVTAVGINGAVNGGCITNHVDIASNHAGILMGITNTAANVCGIVAPYVAGRITNESASVYEWQQVFFITAAVYCLANLVYLMFASGTEQSWNSPFGDDAYISTTKYTRNGNLLAITRTPTDQKSPGAPSMATNVNVWTVSLPSEYTR